MAREFETYHDFMGAHFPEAFEGNSSMPIAQYNQTLELADSRLSWVSVPKTRRRERFEMAHFLYPGEGVLQVVLERLMERDYKDISIDDLSDRSVNWDEIIKNRLEKGLLPVRMGLDMLIPMSGKNEWRDLSFGGVLEINGAKVGLASDCSGASDYNGSWHEYYVIFPEDNRFTLFPDREAALKNVKFSIYPSSR